MYNADWGVVNPDLTFCVIGHDLTSSILTIIQLSYLYNADLGVKPNLALGVIGHNLTSSILTIIQLSYLYNADLGVVKPDLA